MKPPHQGPGIHPGPFVANCYTCAIEITIMLMLENWFKKKTPIEAPQRIETPAAREPLPSVESPTTAPVSAAEQQAALDQALKDVELRAGEFVAATRTRAEANDNEKPKDSGEATAA